MGEHSFHPISDRKSAVRPAIDSKIRGSDLPSVRVDDITADGRLKDSATIVQHKIGRAAQFETLEQTCRLQEWLNTRPKDGAPSLRSASTTGLSRPHARAIQARLEQ
jgi:hypothetical protein